MNTLNLAKPGDRVLALMSHANHLFEGNRHRVIQALNKQLREEGKPDLFQSVRQGGIATLKSTCHDLYELSEDTYEFVGVSEFDRY